MSAAPAALPSGEAHLWYVRPERIADPRLLDAYAGLLTADEHKQHERFALPRLRHQYLVTRALQRSVLSRYTGLAPSAWTFGANQWGRPHIVGAAADAAPRFNLSNAAGFIACLVASGREVGVDVENVERGGSLLAIADRYFSPREVARLRELPASRQEYHFFDYWTLKESYIKARGMGLAIPLDHFSFELAEDIIRIGFDPALHDDPARWQFTLVRPDAQHTLATCVERRGGDTTRIVMRETVPLAD